MTKNKFAGENCVFKLNEEIVNLAGIVGGASTACTSETSSALGAYFIPEEIIGKSLKYDIKSDAAYNLKEELIPIHMIKLSEGL